MKKTILLSLLLLIGMTVLIGAGCSTYSTSSTSNTATQSTNTVSIKNMAFNPQNISITAGTTVTWTNNDSYAHHLNSSLFDSGVMNPGATYQFTFKNAGTVNYSCLIHPSMTGTITVK